MIRRTDGRNARSTIFCLVLTLSCACLLGQPKLRTKAPEGYLVGDRVDHNTLLLDRDLKPHRLGDVIDKRSKVVVLVIIGGGAKRAPEGQTMRGGIWCADSFDDFPLQRALLLQFAASPVQFIAVAVPPVYSNRFGFEEDVFLTHPDDDPLYQKEAREFIEATEGLMENDIVPFPVVYYDPKNRLAQNRKERELDSASFGEIYPWQGKMKWHMDPRRYGTPTIWLLGPEGEVLREPFFGNEYDGGPPEIVYGFFEVKEAIDRFLEAASER